MLLLVFVFSKLSMHVFLYDLLRGGDGDDEDEHDEADEEKDDENEDDAEDGVDIGGVGGDTVLVFVLFDGVIDCCFIDECNLLSSESLDDLTLVLDDDVLLLDVVSSRPVCVASTESCSQLLIFIFH